MIIRNNSDLMNSKIQEIALSLAENLVGLKLYVDHVKVKLTRYTNSTKKTSNKNNKQC